LFPIVVNKVDKLQGELSGSPLTLFVKFKHFFAEEIPMNFPQVIYFKKIDDSPWFHPYHSPWP
jgi:hypothetical protein